MGKEITIYTQDNMYAYKLRNKLLQENWSANYLNSLEDLTQYLKYTVNGILFVDAKINSEYLNSKVIKAKEKLIIVLIDDNNLLDKSLFDSEIIITNLSNILEILPVVQDRYAKKLGVNDLIILNKVAEQLSHFSISPKSLGYTYLKECIVIGFKMESKFLCYKTEVYPIVAREYNVTVGAVEKSIRTAITKASTLFPSLFNSDEFQFGKVTNNQFMNYIIEKLNNDNSLFLI